MKSPFGPVEVHVHTKSVSFRFSDCKVNGVDFKGSFHVLIPDGSENQWSNKFRVDNQSRWIRKINPPNQNYGADHVSENAREKIEGWAIKEAIIQFTPEAQKAAILTAEKSILNRLEGKRAELSAELLKIQKDIADQFAKVSSLEIN